MHSPLKTVLGKIENRYQTYYTVSKTHAMSTHHGGAGHPVARDNLHTEATGIDNDNDSISGLDDTLPLLLYCIHCVYSIAFYVIFYVILRCN